MMNMEVIVEENGGNLSSYEDEDASKESPRSRRTTDDASARPGRRSGVADMAPVLMNTDSEKKTESMTIPNGDHNKVTNGEQKISVGDRKLSPAERKISGAADKKVIDRKVSLGERKSNPIERKVSLGIDAKANNNSGPERKFSQHERRISRKISPGSRKISRADSTVSQRQRKISVLQRTLTQLTFAQLEIGTLKNEEEFEEEFQAKKGPQMLAALAATIGAFGMGTVMAWSSPALPQIEGSRKLGYPSDSDLSWVASLVPLAAAFAGPPAGQCIERIGRKPTMIVLSIPFVLGWLLIAYAENIPMMLAGRFLTGFCAGAFSLTAPVFISETAEASIRGTLGSGFQFMVVLGILFSYVVGAFVSWQWLAIISAFVPVIMLILMIYVPASPRYLLQKGQTAEASKALAWFRGAESSQHVEAELKLIQASIDEAKAKNIKMKDFFTWVLLKPICVSVGLMFFQTFSGTDAVTFYTVSIFEEAGSTLDGNVATIIVGAVQVFATFMSVILVDRAGRRVLLLISGASLAVSLVALGSFFFFDEETKKTAGLLPLISLVVFVSAYSIGFGPLPWMMMGEILPNHVIGIASAIATSLNWIFTFTVIRFFGDLKEAIGPNYAYLGFAAFCVAGLFFTFFFVPETKGKTLDEIQELFLGKNSKIPPPSRRVSRTTVDSYFFA